MKIPLFLSLAATALLQGKSYVLIVVDDLGYMDIGAYNPGSFYLFLIHISEPTRPY